MTGTFSSSLSMPGGEDRDQVKVKERLVKGDWWRGIGGGDRMGAGRKLALAAADYGASLCVLSDCASVLVGLKAAAALRAVARGLASLDPACARLRRGGYARG
jgi:hypothetical protein